MTRLTVYLFGLALLAGSLQAQSVAPRKSSYAPGETITVDFSGGPGNAADWIGIYNTGFAPSGNPYALTWFYTNGTRTSGGSNPSGSVTFTSPTLAAGTYAIWYLANDAYGVIAGPATLTIATPPVTPTEPPKWVTPTFRMRHAVTGSAYTGKISAYASDAASWSKVTGPSWLTVSANGQLTGTPAAGDVGRTSFTIRATNAAGSSDATLQMDVFKAGAELPTTLKVMSYNLWHGWGQINNGYRKGIESIILSDADIIATQETIDNVSGAGTYQAQWIADQLGWYYGPTAAGDSGIVSRYPITEQLTAGIARGIRVQVAASPAREVLLFNCHLDYVYYGPYAARLAGATSASVLAEETRSNRDEEIAAIVSSMAPKLSSADQTPVLLTGDFNAPSHLDWTPATAASHGGVGNVAWPTSVAVINAGMIDSFRKIHPDPVAEPANSWSPLYLGDAQDRIDFIYYKGKGLQPVNSSHFHTAIETTLGAWGASITPAKNNTWPSDHGAMLTEFFLTPADSDDDGLSDAFEILHFGNLTAQNGTGDPDGDGRLNAVEQASGTSPVSADPASPVSLTPPAAGSSTASLQFSLSPLALASGLVCEKSSNLSQWLPVWSYQEDTRLQAPVAVNPDAQGGWTLQLEDPAAGTSSFYRLRSGN